MDLYLDTYFDQTCSRQGQAIGTWNLLVLIKYIHIKVPNWGIVGLETPDTLGVFWAGI